MSDAQYKELVKAHVMFKDMDADPYLKSAGIASDWPCGRGCYRSADGGFIIWFGEEDQLRIMCMGNGFLLNDVFDRLNTALQVPRPRALPSHPIASHPILSHLTFPPRRLLSARTRRPWRR